MRQVRQEREKMTPVLQICDSPGLLTLLWEIRGLQQAAEGSGSGEWMAGWTGPC
jgi:hypothetical protein